MNLKHSRLTTKALTTLLAFASAASAQDALPQLADLNYQDTGWAHDQLARRGYHLNSREQGGYEYWWNSSNRQCAVLRTEGHKVASIVGAPTDDCGQPATSSAHGSSNAKAAAIGAAAVIGAAVLIHNSHHHDDRSQQKSDSDRSYRDYASSEVTCESRDRHRVECDMDTRGNVYVVRQLSHASCIEGQSWGLSKHSVWVEDGCRAVFRKN